MLQLTVETQRRTQLVDVTARVQELVSDTSGSLVTLFVPHTTAGIVVQAVGPGAEAVAQDVESALDRLVDDDWPWEHVHEGDANPWSHVRAVLAGASVSVPLEAGRLALGPRQAVFLAELDGPRTRSVYVAVTA